MEVKKEISRNEWHNITRSTSNIVGNSGQVQSTTKKILASGLAPTITENDMRKYFKQFDKIIIVVVMYDPETQAP